MSRHASAALAAFTLLRARFTEGRAAIPAADWRAWRRTMAAGAAAMVGLMVGLVFAARRLAAAGALDGERAFLTRLGERAPLGFSDAVFFQTFGSDITLIILVTATAATAAWLRRPITTLSIVLAPLVPDLVGRFGWLIWHRARPDVLYEGVASPALHAFPSGHSSKTVATWGLLTLLWVRASRSLPEKTAAFVLLVLIATVVPVGRMAMGVHWPSDVVAGLILGSAWLAVLAYGLRFESASRAAR